MRLERSRAALGPAARIAALLVLLASCDEGDRATSAASATHGPLPDGTITARLVRVVDGDTIRVALDGREEPVRYIGVNTPEVHHPRRGEEPFGREATEANRRLLGDGDVRLAFDVERRDRYGRLLAYVYLPDGTFVNARLVELGFAQVMTVPPNVAHAEEFLALERAAREARRGLWAGAAR